MSSNPMQLARVDGAELEFAVTGAGEPVLLIHGALIAEAYAPLSAEPALKSYRLVRIHRRGYAGSSPAKAPFSLAEQAADCRALLRHLGIERAHIVGHSSGGVIALRLALDAPEVVHSLVLLEPTLLDVPSGALLIEALEPVLEQYGAGDKEGAADSFARWVIGPDYRVWLESAHPGRGSAGGWRRRYFLRRRASVHAGVALHAGGRPADHPACSRRGRRRERLDLAGLERGSGSAARVAAADRAVRCSRVRITRYRRRHPRGVAEAMAPFLARHPSQLHRPAAADDRSSTRP